MDGNRRFAHKHFLPSLSGHTRGYDKLLELLEWSRQLSISTVTVYAFSLDNFSRPPSEINYLMELFKQKFISLIEHRELIMKNSICVKVLGNINLLPTDVKDCINEIVELTRDNQKLFLNIAMAYTSQQEATHSAETLIQLHNENLLSAADINNFSLLHSFYTSSLPHQFPCILLRTSGETRLSDFLLYQSCSSQLYFLDVYWPEFSFYQFLHVIVKFQTVNKNVKKIQEKFQQITEKNEEKIEKEKILKALATIKTLGV